MRTRRDLDPGLDAGAPLERLRELARVRARVELDLGRGLLLFGRGARFDTALLGISRFDDLCLNRLGMSGPAGRELRRLAEAFRRLPRLRDAFLAGLLSRAKVRTLVSIATPDDELGWAHVARQLSTRALERLVADVRAGRRKAPAPCAETDEHLPVTWRASPIDAVLWKRHAVAMLQSALGRPAPEWELAEVLATDVLVSVAGGPPDHESPSSFVRLRVGDALRRTMPRRPRARHRALGVGVATRSEILAHRLLRALARAAPLPSSRSRAADFDACDSAPAALALLQDLAARRHVLDCERAERLEECLRRSVHRDLGCGSFDTFVERLLGLAPREAFAGIELVRRLAFLPALLGAWRSGRASTHDVGLLAEVVEPPTEDAWLRFAEGATRKLLGLAVSWATEESARRLASPDGRSAVEPPWHLAPRQLQADWLTQLGTRDQRRRHRERLASLGPAGDVRADLEGIDDPLLDDLASASGLRGPLARRRVGFSAPVQVASTWWAAVEAVRDHVDPTLTDAGCVRVMLTLFAHSHVTPEVEAHLRQHRALLRDGYRCTAPGCTALGDFHEHHVRFRSRGGSDELSNVTSLCRGCHRLVHEGHLAARGAAPDGLTWTVGRSPARETWRRERLVSAPARPRASPTRPSDPRPCA